MTKSYIIKFPSKSPTAKSLEEREEAPIVPKLEEKELIIGIKDIFNNNLSFGKTNSINNKDSDDDSSKFIEKDVKPKSELVLNPKIPNFLPTDKLYEINEKTLTKEYNKNLSLFSVNI